MNLCTFVGRLTRDPEIRYSEGEQQMAIARFVLAVDRNYKGAKEEETADFFPCVAFDKRAEFAEKYLYKGMRVALCGKMRNNNYTNKDGEKVYGNSLYVDNIEFADGKRDGGGEEPLPQPEEQNTGTARSNSQSAGRGTTQTAGQRTGTRGSQPAGTSARTGTAQPASQTSGAGAAQAGGQTAGTRSAGTARQGTAANRTAARGTATGSGTAGRSAAARGTGARAASSYGNGFMNIPDGVEDEGLPFH